MTKSRKNKIQLKWAEQIQIREMNYTSGRQIPSRRLDAAHRNICLIFNGNKNLFVYKL